MMSSLSLRYAGQWTFLGSGFGGMENQVRVARLDMLQYDALARHEMVAVSPVILHVKELIQLPR